jgi:hypothetical protein
MMVTKMKKAERYYGHTGSAMVYASDYDALLAERDELLAALKNMCAEFRGYDLPYGSAAYAVANSLINKLEQPQ